MRDQIIAFLQNARDLVLERKEIGEGSRELDIVLTHIDSAILWRGEDLRLKTPDVYESNETGDRYYQ